MPGDKLVLVCPEGFGFGLRCPNLCESSNDRAAVQHSNISPWIRDGFDGKLRRFELEREAEKNSRSIM